MSNPIDITGSNRRWILVSNRLPVSRDPISGDLGPSSGGLVAAITGIKTSIGTRWVGAVPPGLSPEAWTEFQASHADPDKYVPIFIEQDLYERYYNGVSNKALWPLFHYESNLVDFNWQDWKAYEEVNEKFADAVASIATEDDLIWVHDFHLFLLPMYLKRRNPKLRVGFFLHIPFPSSEIYRQLPVRREILEALLHADLIGFHDYSYLRHFCSSLQLILGLESSLLTVKTAHGQVQLGVYPVSIDPERIRQAAQSGEVKRILKTYRRKQTHEQTVLGVDRLDYTKGIELKLLTFRDMLRASPDLIGRVVLIQIAVPTRADVPEYQTLKSQVERLVGEVNGEFGRPNYVPIQYIYGTVDFSTLMALYRMADVLFVASKRDGMNLVALEYLVAQNAKQPGTILLSEFTGAVSTLSGITPINPWDTVGTAQTLAKALSAPKEARRPKHQIMLDFLERYTATDWAESFMSALGTATSTAQPAPTKKLEIRVTGSSASLPQRLRDATVDKRLIIFLDYDGTTVPICDAPDLATLSVETRSKLELLSRHPKLELVIVSGRQRKFLAEQFRNLPFALGAEHGAVVLPRRKSRWESLVHSNKDSWFHLAKQIMQDYSDRVPGSFLEEKQYSLSWHYRLSPSDFASYQAKKLREELEIGLANLPITVISGKKVIEARAVEANKGSFARWFLKSRPMNEREVIIAIGDDETDEDLFTSLPFGSLTIKVGDGESAADYRLSSQVQVIPLLEQIAHLADPQWEERLPPMVIGPTYHETGERIF